MASLTTTTQQETNNNSSSKKDNDNGIMKINWTIHGGGSDGYYYNEGELDKKLKMHEDFVKVKDLFEYINKELLPQGKKIKSLKIFRWTSPGASIVSNEDIDDVFREIFEHPYWPQLYQSGAWKTRTAMGKNEKHMSATVGSDSGEPRGPGELMKDLQLFMYDQANPQEESDVFLNELLSTEFINKYTQATSSDFGIWTLHDQGNYENSYPEFEKRVKKTNSTSVKQQKTAAQKLHEDIFKTNVGVGGTPNIKMAEAIKDIIVTLAKNYSADEFPQHWEFYPVTCSPMNGVEGRKTLLEDRKYDKDRYTTNDPTFRLTGPPPKPPQLIRLHTNAGLSFAYMLNMAKRCKVFNDGKRRREKWVSDFNGGKTQEWDEKIEKLDPRGLQFENTFDCMDPDERRQLYMDINMFLQNVRPNATRQQGNVFNAITVVDDEEEEPIDLFKDEQFDKFIKKLENRVKFDNRKSTTNGSRLVTKIEENSLAYINQIIDEVDNVLLEKGMREKTSEKQSIDKAKHEKLKQTVPKILKLLFYVIYQASHHEDGIAKDYGLEYKYNFQGSSGKSSTNYSMGGPEWGLNEEYNFGNAINKWVKSFWAGWSWRPKKMDSVGEQKMARGVSDQLVSTLLNKGPLPSVGYDDWQDKAYEYLQYADGFVRNHFDKVKHDIIYFATDSVITGTTVEEAKQKLKDKVMNFMPSNVSKDSLFDEHYNKAIRSGTIVFDVARGKFYKPKNGGKKRKKRTRRKRKFKFKWSRKRKKQNKKKIIRIKKIKNKTNRSYIKVKKRRKKTRGTR